MVMMMREEEDPIRLAPTDLVPSSKFAKSVGTYLDRAKKRPLFITRGQDVDAVLIGLDEYRALLREQQRFEDISDLLLALERLGTSMLTKEKNLTTEEVMAAVGISQADIDVVNLDELED
jgi:PHD/YefM family antitoxin component YafN of YafNO toxin-antitoxin module